MVSSTHWPERRGFRSLNVQEVLALAISLEEDDARLYQDFARCVREGDPELAAGLDEMRREEEEHRKRLTDLHRRKFGDVIPLIRREDVSGFVQRPRSPRPGEMTPQEITKRVELMELETTRFYERAAQSTTDAEVRDLVNELAAVERTHEAHAQRLQHLAPDPEKVKRHLFILQVVQPGLIGLMDGSVSTLAPIFAAALATQDSWAAFLVGTAAAVGAGISMGFAEGLSDDGSLTGRGKPAVRGVVTGVMTFLGGIVHTLPFLIPVFHIAFLLAMFIVAIELLAIAYVRNHYMETPIFRSVVQVVVGGTLVFLAGVLIGQA
jgi:rubrerythrin